MTSGRHPVGDVLDERLKAILPAEYRDTYEEVQPVSMGSAGLRFDARGRVAWNDMWQTFCDLAMAGGPPHKGTLLQPGSRDSIEARPEAYAAVVNEICRGVRLVSGLDACPSDTPGWVSVACDDETMAGWLLRAIVMENVSVRASAADLDLPAAPGYRLEKEIKNVVTVIAKTSHYWSGHMEPAQQEAIARVFDAMERERPLVVPGAAGAGHMAGDEQAAATRLSEAVGRATGLRRSEHQYPGWVGFDCGSVRAALWMMRMIVASNVLSRREDSVVFVPVNPPRDPDGAVVAGIVADVHRRFSTRRVS